MTDRSDLLERLSEQDALVAGSQESEVIDDQRVVANALLTRGRLLGELGRVDEATAQYADIRRVFAESADAFLRACAAASWISEAYMLGELDRREAALAAYDGAILLTKDSAEPLLQEQAISASYRKALALRAEGRYGEAVEVVAELLNTFVVAAPPKVVPEVLAPPSSLPGIAAVFLLFPLLAGDLGQADRAIPMYDKMIEIFGDQDDDDVQEAVARARLSKAALLGRSGHFIEAIELCHAVLMSIDTGGPAFRTLRAVSLADQGHWLKAAGRNDEASACFREVIDSFRSGQDEEIDEALHRAQRELAA